MRMGSLKEAEAVKVVENSFRDINIAFVNELACSFTKLGIDVVRVIDGAATKPFAFMVRNSFSRCVQWFHMNATNGSTFLR